MANKPEGVLYSRCVVEYSPDRDACPWSPVMFQHGGRLFILRERRHAFAFLCLQIGGKGCESVQVSSVEIVDVFLAPLDGDNNLYMGSMVGAYPNQTRGTVAALCYFEYITLFWFIVAR